MLDEIGTVQPKGTMYLCTRVGTAADGDGNEFELSATSALHPVIRSKKTGKYFTIDWDVVADKLLRVKSSVELAMEGRKENNVNQEGTQGGG
jgi:hypothetical protein